MADLTQAELQSLLASGATVERNNVQISVAGMVQMLRHMGSMVETNKAIASKTNDAMVEAVNKLTHAVKEKSFKPQDLKPLIDSLLNNNKPGKPIAYDFNIERNSRGVMTKVSATPKEE